MAYTYKPPLQAGEFEVEELLHNWIWIKPYAVKRLVLSSARVILGEPRKFGYGSYGIILHPSDTVWVCMIDAVPSPDGIGFQALTVFVDHPGHPSMNREHEYRVPVRQIRILESQHAVGRRAIAK